MDRVRGKGSVGADGNAEVSGQLLDDGLRVDVGDLLQQGRQLLQRGEVGRLRLQGKEEQQAGRGAGRQDRESGFPWAVERRSSRRRQGASAVVTVMGVGR